MRTNPRHTITPIRIGALAIAIGLAALMIPALAAAGSKPKDGGYVQQADKQGVSGFVGTLGGKVTYGGASLIFKAKGGGKCRSAAIKNYTNGKVTFVTATPSKPVNVKNGKFRFSDNSSQSGFKTTISGKFKSKTKAKIKVTSKVKGCAAKGKFSKAKYTSGG